MSPRHFSKIMNKPLEYKEIKDGMTLWFAFFAVTGIDKTITKLFVFTPDSITNHPVKDLDKVQGKDQN